KDEFEDFQSKRTVGIESDKGGVAERDIRHLPNAARRGENAGAPALGPDSALPPVHCAFPPQLLAECMHTGTDTHFQPQIFVPVHRQFRLGFSRAASRSDWMLSASMPARQRW